MAETVKTMKLHIHPDEGQQKLLMEFAMLYTDICNYISQFIFDCHFNMGISWLHDQLYYHIRETFGSKSQMTLSAFRTVTQRFPSPECNIFRPGMPGRRKSGCCQSPGNVSAVLCTEGRRRKRSLGDIR